jgi:hypothetical protein
VITKESLVCYQVALLGPNSPLDFRHRPHQLGAGLILAFYRKSSGAPLLAVWPSRPTLEISRPLAAKWYKVQSRGRRLHWRPLLAFLVPASPLRSVETLWPRALFVVIMHPTSSDIFPWVAQAGDRSRFQASLTQPSGEAFGVAILYRPARLDEHQSQPTFFAAGCRPAETPARCPQRLLSAAHAQLPFRSRTRRPT